MKRRQSIFIALGATLAALIPWGRRSVAPTFAQNTVPGNRYRTLTVGGKQIYVREDLIASGWYRDFRSHAKDGS